MTTRKFRVLSTSHRNAKTFIVDARHVNKGKAKKVARRERGWYWGSHSNSQHRKVGTKLNNVPKKYKKHGDLYKVYSHIQ
ncbi:MAG TPA: hypothetical protein VMY59_08900 [Candidatus Thermoplasmatota archaeon]|nr:hypothetical protein [Candidatus Thermoplasmatota archaeon]